MAGESAPTRGKWKKPEKWQKPGGEALRALPEFDLVPERSAFVILDMQYLVAHRDYGIGATIKQLGTWPEWGYYFDRLEKVVIPNIQKLQRACRQRGVEVIFARTGSFLKDSRDVNRMHKRLGLSAVAGSKEFEILEEIRPQENEMVITKGCSGIFNGTNIDQVLANMGINNLIFCGVSTNYAIDTSVRGAGDRDYDAILLSDACATTNPEHHQYSLEILDNIYCKVKTTDEVIDLIELR